MAADLNNTQEKSRASLRKARTEEETKLNNKPRRKRKIRIRLIPIWLRLFLIAIILTLSAISGVIVGYGVIGDGKVSEAFDKSTWEHIIDLVEKDNVE